MTVLLTGPNPVTISGPIQFGGGKSGFVGPHFSGGRVKVIGADIQKHGRAPLIRVEGDAPGRVVHAVLFGPDQSAIRAPQGKAGIRPRLLKVTPDGDQVLVNSPAPKKRGQTQAHQGGAVPIQHRLKLIV